ncbi:hypothetical protein M378DRAFT_903354 [Amanita muscaria Koide BX008]|uniref:Uncharacterized protein n=1 Tax=Amanita muscaria (strain Koide BX008) TaxID=946122 RepID=A0A0C2WVS5_AMAMK|nr:hypothetical protein M378DRAFT_903354 [Amanita muscaria Koide BX008]
MTTTLGLSWCVVFSFDPTPSVLDVLTNRFSTIAETIGFFIIPHNQQLIQALQERHLFRLRFACPRCNAFGLVWRTKSRERRAVTKQSSLQTEPGYSCG